MDLAGRLARCAWSAHVVGGSDQSGQPFIARDYQCRSLACSVCLLVQRRRYEARYAAASNWLAERFPALKVVFATITETHTHLDQFTEYLHGFKGCLGRLIRSPDVPSGGYVKKIEFSQSQAEYIGVHAHLVLLISENVHGDVTGSSLSYSWQRIRRLRYMPNARAEEIPLTTPAFVKLGTYLFKPIAPKGSQLGEFARMVQILGGQRLPRVCHGGLVRMALHDCARRRDGHEE